MILNYEIPSKVLSNRAEKDFIFSFALSRVERFPQRGNPTFDGATDRLAQSFIPLGSFLKNRANDNISLKREEGHWHDTYSSPYLDAAVTPPTEYTSPRRLFNFYLNRHCLIGCHIGGVCLNDKR